MNLSESGWLTGALLQGAFGAFVGGLRRSRSTAGIGTPASRRELCRAQWHAIHHRKIGHATIPALARRHQRHQGAWKPPITSCKISPKGETELLEDTLTRAVEAVLSYARGNRHGDEPGSTRKGLGKSGRAADMQLEPVLSPLVEACEELAATLGKADGVPL